MESSMGRWTPIRGLVATLATVAALAAAPVSGQTPASPAPTRAASKPTARYTPAKTPWGDPDLQGIYTDKDENGIPMERPGQFAGKRLEDIDDSELADLVRQRQEQSVANAAAIGGADTGAGPVHWYEFYDAKNSRPWLISDPADGRMPALTPAAEQRASARAAARRERGPADSWEDRSLYDRCITRGIVGSMLPVIYGNSFQIVQGPGSVAIRYEMVHEARIVPLDGRSHVAPAVRMYMGDARGHWEGHTLVVETTNFTDRTAIGVNGNGTFTSGSLRLIERFTPTSATTVEWTVTVDDAQTWVRPWTFGLNLTKDASQEVFEYACHEGNYGLRNILSAARAEEHSKP
jgi:hypothetical protein